MLRRERAQGLVEFAVIFPIFAILIFAVIDGGLVMGRYNNINNGAKEGARLAAVGGNDLGAVHDRIEQQTHGLLDGATTGCGGYAAASDAICVEWFTGPDGEQPGAVGSSVRVRVKYEFEPITPFLNLGDWTITACAVQRTERPVNNPPTVNIPGGTDPC
jgi:Flp pilus assembly protein TadG